METAKILHRNARQKRPSLIAVLLLKVPEYQTVCGSAEAIRGSLSGQPFWFVQPVATATGCDRIRQ
jgi:hypothetical protein